MDQDFRVLAQRHMWLSWLWGMYTTWAVSLLGAVYVLIASHKSISAVARSLTEIGYLLLIGFVGTMVFLGLPALLGALVRRLIIQRIIRLSDSMKNLLWRTVLVFEASVILCWLLWELYTWVFNPLSIRVLPRQHFVTTTLAFFGLSLPWLLSSVAAAWWLGRRLFPR